MLANANLIVDNRSTKITIPLGVDMSPEAISMEMTAIAREAAEPGIAGESVKAALRRAASRLGLTFRRTKSYWYGEVRTVPAYEADTLRRARRQMMRDRAARLSAELQTLKLRLQHLENDT